MSHLQVPVLLPTLTHVTSGILSCKSWGCRGKRWLVLFEHPVFISMQKQLSSCRRTPEIFLAFFSFFSMKLLSFLLLLGAEAVASHGSTALTAWTGACPFCPAKSNKFYSSEGGGNLFVSWNVSFQPPFLGLSFASSWVSNLILQPVPLGQR